MAAVGIPQSRRAVLDSGAVLALTQGDPTARAALVRARREGYGVVLPTPVVAEVHRGGHARARVDRVLNSVDEVVPTTFAMARLAGELLAASGTSDAVDAIVAAEALASVPAIVITSDPQDLRALLDTQADGRRVAVVAV